MPHLGTCPTLADVLGGSAAYITRFLRRVGRVNPPIDRPADRGNDAPRVVCKEEEEQQQHPGAGLRWLLCYGPVAGIILP